MSITEHLVVAAIELGRLESGYVISTLHEFNTRPTLCGICVWYDQFRRPISKIPTSILFDPKKNFNSFGLEAVQRYSELVSEKEQQDWLLFPHFKMQLYKKSIMGLNLTLESENGETMDALTVYSAAIRYLKDHCLENPRNAFDEEDVLFVLPVPAIWSDQAKKFMREAAEKAGIKKDNILIVLESDAVAVYCEYCSAEEIGRSNVKRFRAFQPGSKYIVMDAEDRSIDITAHEVKRNNKIQEVLKVNDVAWEVTRVDEAYRALLEDLFGEKVIQECSQEHEHDMLDIFEEFAIKKKTIKPELRENISIRIPPLLIDTFRKLNNGKEFKLALEDKPKYAGKISLMGNMLRMDPAIAKDLFTDTMNNIVCLMRKLMQDEVMRDAEFILIVGGFSESPMLVHAIREAFPQKMMISPREADFSVMKGALHLGHLQLEIDHHVSKYTYAIEASP